MATSLQFLLAARTCTIWRWSHVRPLWLVTTPTRLPARGAKSCSTSTSRPVFTRAASAAQHARFKMQNDTFSLSGMVKLFVAPARALRSFDVFLTVGWTPVVRAGPMDQPLAALLRSNRPARGPAADQGV